MKIYLCKTALSLEPNMCKVDVNDLKFQHQICLNHICDVMVSIG